MLAYCDIFVGFQTIYRGCWMNEILLEASSIYDEDIVSGMNGHMMKSSILLRMMLLPLVHTKKDVMNTSQLQFRVQNMKYLPQWTLKCVVHI